MAVWGVVNQKGGVGKTTTAVNLAACLAHMGNRVLLVDCDPQGNATTGLGVDKSKLEGCLFTVLVEVSEGNADAMKGYIRHVRPNFDLVPSTLDLAGAELSLANVVGRELVLSDALGAVRGDYDWILLDAPPSLGLLTINVLGASEKLLVPLQTEFYALEGLTQLMKAVELVKKRINPTLEIGKVLLTMHDQRHRLARQVAEEVHEFFKGKVAHTAIPRNVRLSEAPGFGVPVHELYPESKGAEAYLSLAKEVSQTCVAH